MKLTDLCWHACKDFSTNNSSLKGSLNPRKGSILWYYIQALPSSDIRSSESARSMNNCTSTNKADIITHLTETKNCMFCLELYCILFGSIYPPIHLHYNFI